MLILCNGLKAYSPTTVVLSVLIDHIRTESKKIFEDVVDDFHSLDSIKSHFEVWRKFYFNCYRDAYIGLCLPKLFNPLVRLQLISWSPLEVLKNSAIPMTLKGIFWHISTHSLIVLRLECCLLEKERENFVYYRLN